MENVYVMKKAALTAIIFLAVLVIPVFALDQRSAGAEKTDVTVRAGRQEGILRLVFEAEESFLKKTNVSSSGMQINIEFPFVFNLKPQKDFNLETSAKERILTINLKEPFEVKVLRLSSPPRLVVDIATAKAKGPADIKAQTEVILSQKVFVIDPGHGGYDFGIMSSELKEKDIVLAIAKDIEAILIKRGKTVFLTRKSDQSVQLRDRAMFANQKMPEIFISIHTAASENFVLYVPMIAETGSEQSASDAYGLSSRQRKYAQKSMKLAEALGKAVKEEFNLNVVQREMSLPVLNSVGAPAVLIEVPSFKIMSYDQKTRARLAEAIIKGISYYGQ